MRIPEEAIPALAFLFEREAGNGIAQVEIDEIEKHGFSDIDPNRVKKSLLREMANTVQAPNSRYRNRGYWALGKLRDSDLLPFFRESLKQELNRDIESAYQIMIALDNLDEQIFSRDTVSIIDYDQNRLDAERYLKKV